MYPGDNTEEYLNFLLGPAGQKMLDLQIAKAKNDVGDQKFEQYAQQFFEQLSHKGIIAKPAIISQIKHVENQEQIVEQKVESQAEFEEQQQAFETTDDYEPHFQINKESLAQNKFKITYNNGDLYEGEMESNEKNGWGIYYYSNGEKYDGLFVDDLISGFGKYYFLSGAIYEGDWYQGQKHGFGTLKFSNKDEYIGQFKEDELNGKGVYKYSNGDSFEGTWVNGKKHGRGQLTSLDGRVMIGQWTEDQFSI